MKRYLQQVGIWSQEYEDEIWETTRFKINKAIADQENTPQPDWSTMFENVYADMPETLKAQRDDFLARERGLKLTNEGEFPL
jgi:TPP-dependent pyruvate/acetoin dehydrogenase alpha subunit